MDTTETPLRGAEGRGRTNNPAGRRGMQTEQQPCGAPRDADEATSPRGTEGQGRSHEPLGEDDANITPHQPLVLPRNEEAPWPAKPHHRMQ